MVFYTTVEHFQRLVHQPRAFVCYRTMRLSIYRTRNPNAATKMRRISHSIHSQRGFLIVLKIAVAFSTLSTLSTLLLIPKLGLFTCRFRRMQSYVVCQFSALSVTLSHTVSLGRWKVTDCLLPSRVGQIHATTPPSLTFPSAIIVIILEFK